MKLHGILIAIFLGLAMSAWAQEPPDLDQLRANVQAEPENGSAWYALGRGLQDQEQYDEALDAYRRAAELGFQPGGAWMRSAQIVAAAGATDKALDYLEQVMNTAPMALSFLPRIGGIPELAGDPRLEALLARAEQARYPCRTRPESRQFDFWLGHWEVSNPQGLTVGKNVISQDLEGCVIRESWTDGYGGRGISVNFYDPATERWHQVWTSDNGTVTHYVGEWRDGAMRFEARGFGSVDGKNQFRRMTFTPNADGTVRQFIESSTDGENWTASFDGLYRRMEQPATE